MPARSLIVYPQGGGSVPPPSVFPVLGSNLNEVTYFTPEQPFLNIVKQGGSSYNTQNTFNGWIPSTTNGSGDTGDQSILLNGGGLNADGYPTTVNGASLGGTYTRLYFIVNNNTGNLAGTAFYPAGSYTVLYNGAATFVIGRDANATITASGQTFNVASPSNSGLSVTLTAMSAQISNLAIVPTSLLASYNAGAIFHPNFLATVQNYKCFRFMDWLKTNANGSNQHQFFSATPTAAINAGATSCTTTGAWYGPSGSYTAYFDDCEKRTVTLATGSTAVSWTGGLTGSPGTASFYVSIHPSWASRPLPSNCFYTGAAGVPAEICIALANTIGADAWLNAPIDADDTYLSGLHNLCATFAGGQAGSNSGYPTTPIGWGALKGTEYSEISNEVWNLGTFSQGSVAALMGGNLFPGGGTGRANYTNRVAYYGYICAHNATLAQTAWGANFNRCIPIIAGQAGNTTVIHDQIVATQWGAGPVTNYPVKAYAFAPYFDLYQAGGGSYVTAADIITILGQPQGSDSVAGLSMFFQAFTSNPGLTSVPAGGWLSVCQTSFISNNVSYMAANFPTLALVAYEGGQSMVPSGYSAGLTGAQLTAWETLNTTAQTDPRMQAVYTTYLNLWSSLVGKGNLFCHFSDCSAFSPTVGYWGALQNVTETISPLSAAPPKYHALQSYITGQP